MKPTTSIAILFLAIAGLILFKIQDSQSNQNISDNELTPEAKLVASGIKKIPNDFKSNVCEFKMSKGFRESDKSVSDLTVEKYLQLQIKEIQSNRDNSKPCSYDITIEVHKLDSQVLVVMSVIEVNSGNKVSEITETAKKNPGDFSPGSK